MAYAKEKGVKPQSQFYPKPGPEGGRLIRKVVTFLKAKQISCSKSTPVYIAVSGGVDSMALASLLITYGRRVVPRENISILHINHGWRGRQSNQDALFVKKYAKNWGVPFQQINFKKPKLGSGRSWEEEARTERKKIYNQLPGFVFTAHHADDLAETMLWRLFTGAAQTHGGGILVRDGNEIRPFLKIRKAELKAYLEEEGTAWREDHTNFEERFLRAKMRLHLMPLVEQIFPRSVEHLIRYALQAQPPSTSSQTQGQTQGFENMALLFSASQLRLRRAHWDLLKNKLSDQRWVGEVNLAGGWKLSKEKKGRWILEKMTTS